MHQLSRFAPKCFSFVWPVVTRARWNNPLGGNRSCAGLLEVHRNGSWCFDCVCVASSCSSASESEGVELRLQARWSAHVANVLALSCIVAREPAWLWSAQCCAVVGWLVAWFQAFRGTFEAKCEAHLGEAVCSLCCELILRGKTPFGGVT